MPSSKTPRALTLPIVSRTVLSVAYLYAIRESACWNGIGILRDAGVMHEVSAEGICAEGAADGKCAQQRVHLQYRRLSFKGHKLFGT